MSAVDNEWDNLKSTTDLEEGFRREKVGVHIYIVHMKFMYSSAFKYIVKQ